MRQPSPSSPDLKKLIREGAVDTVIAAFTDHYGRLMGKRFDADYFLAEVAAHGTHACNYLLTTDAEMEPVPGYQFANWELGYGDFHMVPDMPTARLLSWQDKTALVHCNLENVPVAPRAILQRQIARSATLGFEAMEARQVLSGCPVGFAISDLIRRSNTDAIVPAATAGPTGLSPSAVRHAYGFDSVSFGGIAGDGAGTTIANSYCRMRGR